MKILFLTTQFPYPLDNGGKIGAYNGLSVLSKGKNDITVLSFSEEPNTIKEGIEYYKNTFQNITFKTPILHSVHIRKKPFKLIQAMLRNYFFCQPYVVAKFHNKKMYQEIDGLFSHKKWDIVFIDYLNMSSYGEYIQRKYKDKYSLFILKDHNIEFELVKQEAANSKGLKKLILEEEWKRTKKYEINRIKEADCVFSVCDDNTNVFKKINKNSYSMLPAFEMLEIKRPYPRNNNILYMGNLSWGANSKGLIWFVNNVLPIIKAKVKDVNLIVVGSGSSNNMFKDNECIDYRGYVKDISGIYDNIKVFIVPLFEGSGIRIKILEAFNNEVPVVSTELGCSTIGAVNKSEIYIEDSPGRFADAVIQLIKNPELNVRVRYKAKEFLRNRFSLDSRYDEFYKIIIEVCKNRGQKYV